MGIIQNLQARIIELERINKFLQNKISSIDSKIGSLYNESKITNQITISPSLTKTLDSNNIWIGNKGVSEYTDLALLDIYYDSVDEKWRPFECETGVVPLDDADTMVTLIWDATAKKFIVYKNPPYAIYYPG